MLKILVTNRNTQEQKSYHFSKNTIVMGRHGDCDVILPSTGISRRHAQFMVNKNLIELEDLGSGNGTQLGSEKIRPRERYPVKSGDLLKIEEFNIEVNITSSGQTAPKQAEVHDDSVSATLKAKFDITDPDIIEIKMIKKVLGALDNEKQALIQVVSDPFSHQRKVFDDGMDELVIGREPGCNLIIDDSSISRRHAGVALKWGNYVIRDLGSKNGTFLNGERLADERTLKDGDEIVCGTIKMFFRNPQELDFSAISRAIEEGQNQASRLQADGKPADGDLERSPVASEMLPPPQVAAQKASAKDSKTKAPAPQPEVKDNTPAGAKPPTGHPKPQKEPLPTPPAAAEIPAGEPVAKPSGTAKLAALLAKFSPFELALFGLAGLVIVIIVITFGLIFF